MEALHFLPDVYAEVAKMMTGDFSGYEAFYNQTVSQVYSKLCAATKDEAKANEKLNDLYQNLYGRMATLNDPKEFDQLLDSCVKEFEVSFVNPAVNQTVQGVNPAVSQTVQGASPAVNQSMAEQYQAYQGQRNFSDNFQDPYEESQRSYNPNPGMNVYNNGTNQNTPAKNENNNSKKFIIIGVIAAVVIAAIITAVVIISKNKKPDEKITTEATTEITTEEKTTEATTTEVTTELTTEVTTELTTEVTTAAYDDVIVSENLFDYQIGIDGDAITFPLMVSDLKALGWECTDDEEAMVPSGKYSLTYFKKGDDKVLFYTMNFGVNEIAVKDCVICGASVDAYLFKGVLNLPKGLKYNVSTATDVRNAYGSPNDSYDSDSYPTETYSEDYYSYIKFTYDKANGSVIHSFDIKHFVEPEGLDKGEIDTTTVPEITKAYVAPTEISSDFHQYTVEYAGNLYKLPAPVSEFIANGWEIVPSKSAETVDGSGSEKVTLKKDGQEFWTYVRNYDKNATLIENCYITEVSGNVYDCNVDIKISNGIAKGGDESTIESAAAGYTVEKKVESSYTLYEIKDDRSLTYHYEIVVRNGKIDAIEVQYAPRFAEFYEEKGLTY